MNKLVIYLSFFPILAWAGVGGSVGGSSSNSRTVIEKLQNYDASLSYVVHWPTVNMSALNVPVKSVCVDRDLIKTLKPIKHCTREVPVEICIRRGHGAAEECRAVRPGEKPKDDYGVRFVMGCADYRDDNFETPKMYTAPTCIHWEQDRNFNKNSRWVCTEFGTENKTYPEDYQITVTASGYSSTRNPEPIETLPYNIPSCDKEPVLKNLFRRK